MPITPEELAKNNSEEGHQTAFFCALVPLQKEYPMLRWCHAIPNGGARDAITAGVLKKTGVKAGVWDVFLPYPCGKRIGLYLEFKKPTRRCEPHGGLSPLQLEFGKAMLAVGYEMALVYTWQEALQAVKDYLGKD